MMSTTGVQDGFGYLQAISPSLLTTYPSLAGVHAR